MAEGLALRDAARARVEGGLADSGKVRTAETIERVSYKVSQAAAATGVSRYVLYDAIRDGHLLAFQPTVGGDILILSEHLRAWITQRPVSPRTEDACQDEAEGVPLARRTRRAR
jgi:excisionase family DNA binding protein